MKDKRVKAFIYAFLLIIFQSITLLAQDRLDSIEDQWATIDFISIKKAILIETKITNEDKYLYNEYLDKIFNEAQFNFFNPSISNSITFNALNYSNSLVSTILSNAPNFEVFKKEYAAQKQMYSTLSFNGPCNNIDFESGTTNGWESLTAKACENVKPCNSVSGFSATQHQIMTSTMVDPYIPTLPVVAPGGNYSLRLENYVNGGNASMVRQTFMVTPTNNIFTYQYAAVLEDPGKHRDLERPYFKVRMYAANGNEISCATYTAIAKPPISNFVYAKVPNPKYKPGGGGNNNDPFLDLYYRDWTTITIPLLGYEGQNVTIEFIASDCSRGAHLGYAYIDASCSFIDTKIPPTICGGENVTLYGPENFDAYLWSGPGIVGSKTSQNVIANKSGIYKLKLTPLADKPCPLTIQTVVPERCIPIPITEPMCETIKGSGKKDAIDLTSYDKAITAYSDIATVLEWHSDIPAAATNLVLNPKNITVSNGSKYYAIIKYSTVGTDTAELNFVIHSTPNVTLADINPFCKNTKAVQISGATPTGGIFSGVNISSTGMFTPITDGTNNIKYIYTNDNGCIDSVKKTIIVKKPVVLTIEDPQSICSSAISIDLSLSATAQNETTVAWSGGNGIFSDKKSLLTNYSPSINELKSNSITLSLKVSGSTPCPSITESIVINIIPFSKVNAGIDQDICLPITSPIKLVGGTTNSIFNNWTGGSETFSDAKDLETTYNPTIADTEAGTLLLVLTSTAKQPCPIQKDSVEIRFNKPPIADAGHDKIVCNGTVVLLKAEIRPKLIYTWESIHQFPIASSNEANILANKDTVIILKVKNQFGCVGLDTMAIDAFKPPKYDLEGPYCMRNELVLNAHAILGDLLLNNPIWYKDSIEIIGEHQTSLSVSKEGMYMISYKQGECISTSSTQVYANPVLVTPDQVTECESESTILTTSNIPYATYTWIKNGKIIGTDSYKISTDVTKGISKYIVSVVNQHNCISKDSLLLDGIPKPIVELRDTSICENNSAILDGTPLNMNELSNYMPIYKWSFNNVELSKNITSKIEVSNKGNYSLVASIDLCTNSTSMNLTTIQLPKLILQSPRSICIESEKEIVLDAGMHTKYSWQPTGETSKEIKVIKAGIYTVNVFNNSNCSVSGTIEVKEICPPRLFIGDAFSPNKDGTNDLFNVYGVHIGSYKLLIYNRWGEIIFESTDKDHYWDGVYKGEIMPIGVYPWTIIYEGDSQEYLGPYKLEGSVTLVK